MVADVKDVVATRVDTVAAVVVDERAVVGGTVDVRVAVVDLAGADVEGDAGGDGAAAETVMSAQFLNCSPQFACTGASGQVPQREPHQDETAQPSEAKFAK